MDSLYLVRCGVPYDVAFGLDDAARMAYTVVFGMLDGLNFDWKRLRWLEPE
jgi:hypothetical protein